MKKALIFLICASFLIGIGGCARGCESCNRDFQTGNRTYHIEQYSGGKLIKEWKFDGILNNQENSDGYYFSIGDTLVEINGDMIVKSVR